MSKTRSANNMGTVRKRPDGRWEGRYTAPDGKQHSVYAKSSAACTAALRAAQNEVDSGLWVEPSELTVEEWLRIWLKDYQGHTSERTINKYRSMANSQFIPSLGKVKVSKLLPFHVRHLISDMQENGLKASTIDNYFRVFKTSINCAIEAGLIKSNPALRVKSPRPSPNKFTIIDRTELPAFFAAAEKQRYSNELLFMILTGLRVGEVRGLKWGDIDFKAGTIHVQRQLQPKIKQLKQITPPKYGEDRLLHVAKEVITALTNQKKKQAEQRLAAGAEWIEDETTRDLVFRQRSGAAHTRGTIDRAVKAVGREIGKPDIHPHDLRHSYAIAALRSGANVKTVQYNLGHKTAKMTLDIYVAYTEDTGKNDALKLSAYLDGISGKS